MKKLFLTLALLWALPLYAAVVPETKLQAGDSVVITCTTVPSTTPPDTVPTPPVGNKDPATKWRHVTLPTKNGKLSGSPADEISQKDILAGKDVLPYFRHEVGSYLFIGPDGGALTSSNTSSARTEPRYDKERHANEYDADCGKFSIEDASKIEPQFKPEPLDNKNVFGQRHNAKEPDIKFVDQKKGANDYLIYALVKKKNGAPDTRYEWKTHVTYSQKNKACYEYVPNGDGKTQTLNLTFNGVKIIIPDMARDDSGGLYYGKGWATYNQNHTKQGTATAIRQYFDE